MLNINIITVGKLKEKYLRDACDEYIKRLGAFCKISVVELSESRLSDSPSEKEILNALENEAAAMEGKCGGSSVYNIAMCIEGKQMPSDKLAKQLERIAVDGKSTINFIIGSSFGISERIKKSADMKLSMSEMTFPHQLARVMLLEQIYRCFMISNGNKYHK